MRVSVIGLGKLGCSIVAAVASRGFEVIGVDVRPAAVAAFCKGEAPVYEAALQDTVAANSGRIRATSDHTQAICESDISFIIVPTPSDPQGGFSLDHVRCAFIDVASALKLKKEYHVVVLKSTVLPGSCRYVLIPLLEEISGKKAGVDFGFCYSPEFIALGGIVRDFLNPDFRLIGEHDGDVGTMLENFYAKLADSPLPCRRMSLENAELSKMAVDAFITTKISFANTVAEICERIPGGDVDAVADVLGLDRRIGRKCLTGGVPYGGPCFPRDSVAFSRLAQIAGTQSPVSEATDEVNRGLRVRLAERVLSHAAGTGGVGVLGLAFKPGSDVTEESEGVFLTRFLSDRGIKVRAYDRLVRHLIPASEGAEAPEIVSTAEECIASSQLIVITLPEVSLQQLSPALFEGKKVFDYWRIMRKQLGDKSNVKYLPVGLGAESPLLQAHWSTQSVTVQV